MTQFSCPLFIYRVIDRPLRGKIFEGRREGHEERSSTFYHDSLPSPHYHRMKTHVADIGAGETGPLGIFKAMRSVLMMRRVCE